MNYNFDSNLDSKNYYTPYYNSLILQDLVMDENTILLKEIVDANQNVQDALILLKIWLTQKNLGVRSIFITNCISLSKLILILGIWKYFKFYIIHVCGVFI